MFDRFVQAIVSSKSLYLVLVGLSSPLFLCSHYLVFDRLCHAGHGSETSDEAPGPSGGAFYDPDSCKSAFPRPGQERIARPVHMGGRRLHRHEPTLLPRSGARGGRDALRQLRLGPRGPLRTALQAHDTAHRVQESLVWGVHLLDLQLLDLGIGT